MITSRRSSTLRFVTASLIAAMAAFAPSHAAKTLKIATTSPEGSSWMQLLREAIAQVDSATEGRVTFKVYAGGARGKDDNVVMRRVRNRELQGAVVTAAVFNTSYPDVQIYNLPMAFRSFAEVDAVRESLDPVLIDGLRKVGFEAFGIAEVGMAYAMSTKKARTVADGRRLKVWSPQGDLAAERTLQAFGIAPVQLTIADIYAGLQSGLIDTVPIPPLAAVPLRLHTKLKYVVDLPLMYIYGIFIVANQALEGISNEDLEAMRSILGAAVREADRRNRRDQTSIRQVLENQGLEYIELTPEEVEDWRTYAAAAANRWREDGIISPSIYAKLAAKLDEVRSEATPSGPEQPDQ